MKYVKRALKRPILDGDMNLAKWSKAKEDSWKKWVKKENRKFVKRITDGKV
jgi:hypothetical protein